MATWGLVAVLLVTTGFALWTSQYTARVSRDATDSSRLSNDFADAADAVAAQESLERKYRLEPGPEVRERYDAAADALVEALQRVRNDGDGSDLAIAHEVTALHGPYLDAIDRLFAAVDRGDTELVLAIDGGEVDPLFEQIELLVDAAASERHDRSIEALRHLGSVERFTARTTPVVFVIGLMFIAVFASVLRRVRRQLDRHRDQALHDSMHDTLTGLPNRVLLADQFAQVLRADHRSGRTTGLLLIDLDRFKEVNDTLGHHYGDELLTQIGPRISSAIREFDTVARLGGDEFAVLLPDSTDINAACAVAERVRDSLTERFVVKDIELNIDGSIGVVVSDDHGDDPAVLLQRADVAMYVAKDQGIGICAYDQTFDGNSRERLSLLGELRQAIDNDEFFLDYQPKVSLTTGALSGAEALIRWQHPTRGLIRPDEFIPLAEHTALIGPLTLHVIDLALAQVRSWLDLGHRIPVAVNLSARNMVDPRLIDQILASLTRHAVDTELLEFEITESAMMTEPVRATEMLNRLRDHGLRVAIDDFGVGYTSLAQLKTLPVTELKIDRSFVMTMDTDKANDVIVRSIIDLSHHLGLTAVAEGVETRTALDTLTGYGCDLAQGYYLARPGSPDKVLMWNATQLLASPARLETV